MGSGFGSCIFFFFFLFHALLLLQYPSATNSREIKEGDSFTGVGKILQMSTKHEMKYDQDQKGRDKVKIKEENHQKMIKEHLLHQHSSLPHAAHMDPKDPQLQVFFTVNDLKAGKKMPVYFPVKDPSTIPPLLSGEEADSIPFSSAHLPQLLELFSFPDGSPQAKAMESTLEHCEFAAMKGETKFCATSLESLLDSVRSIFGSNAKFKVLTTNHLTKTTTSLLQNYTILSTPKEISVSRIIGCHPLPFPYAVYYCHSQVSDNKLFKVSLLGENGSRIEAVAMCHMDTSQWNRDHVAFMVLKTEPGKSPVCHFFPADNLVWVPSS